MNRFLLLLLPLLLVACTSSDKKAAQSLLDQAKVNVDEGRYDQALFLLDSLHKSYPKAIEERHAALIMIRDARLMKSRRDSSFIAPGLVMLIETEKEVAVLFKEVRSEEIEGHSIMRYKNYDPTDRPRDTYLDVYFNNAGGLELVLAVSGAKALLSEGITITETSSDTFVVSDIVPYDGGNNYRYTVDGVNYERITFTGDNAERLAGFVSGGGQDAKYEVKVTGEKGQTKTFVLSRQAVEAIKATYDLHNIRHQISETRKELERHDKRVKLYN